MTSESSERELPVEELESAEDDTPPLEYPAPAEGESRQSLREEGPARQGSSFDPTPYIRQLRGRGGGGDYLDVKWRLLWLRKEHPDAEIVTDLVQFDAQMAIFKATVTIATGGKATGYGSETASDFPDFIEKAETKAIGRALNALGYGAQFSERSDDPALNRGGERAHTPPTPPAARPVALPRQEPGPASRSAPRAEIVPEETPVVAASPTTAESPTTMASPATAASSATSDAELVEYSWSAFWPWARERRLNGPKEIEMLIGQAVAGLSPAELRDFILAADAKR